MLFYATTILCSNGNCKVSPKNVEAFDQSIEAIASLFIDFGFFLAKNRELIRYKKSAIDNKERFLELIKEDTHGNSMKRMFYTTMHDKIITDQINDENVCQIVYVGICYYLDHLMNVHFNFLKPIYENNKNEKGYILFPSFLQAKSKFLHNLVASNEYFIEQLCLDSSNGIYSDYKKNV